MRVRCPGACGSVPLGYAASLNSLQARSVGISSGRRGDANLLHRQCVAGYWVIPAGYETHVVCGDVETWWKEYKSS